MKQSQMAKRTSQPLVGLTAITLLAALLTFAGRAIITWHAVLPDYITYWTAGSLVANGMSPYDVDSQTSLQHSLGWDRSTQGRGVLSFLPYYYPPWFALACTVLIPLGYQGGKLAWLFLNLELLFVTGFLLRNAVPGLPRSIPLVAVPVFLFSPIALFVGQTSIVIFFLAALALRFVQGGFDRAAGVALACLTTKPQLAAIVVVAVGIWAVRQRRLAVIQAFLLTLAMLCLTSTMLLPSWPVAMIRAPRITPTPTETFPWLGNTWFLILRSLGLRSWALWTVYLVVAFPVLVAVVRSALDRNRRIREVIALGLLAVFFVAPYARHYDFVVLLIPAFVLIGDRLSEKAGALLLLSLILAPYLQFILVARYSRLLVPDVNFYLECTYFWVPALLAALWMATRSRTVTACAAPANDQFRRHAHGNL